MGISVTHWTGQGKLRIASGETILYLGRDRKQIDHTLVNRRFRNSIPDTRVLRSILDTRVLRLADFESDHYLVCTIIKHQLKKENKHKKPKARDLTLKN